MAMSVCVECGTRVSTEAASCPHCGALDPAVDTRRDQAAYESELLACQDEVALKMLAERILRRFPESELAKFAATHDYKMFAAKRGLDALQPGAWYFMDHARPEFIDQTIRLFSDETLAHLGLVRVRIADVVSSSWADLLGERTLLCRASDKDAVAAMIGVKFANGLQSHDEAQENSESWVWRYHLRGFDVDERARMVLFSQDFDCVALRLTASADSDDQSYLEYYGLKGYYLFTDSMSQSVIHLGDIQSVRHRSGSEKRTEKLKLPGPVASPTPTTPHYGTGALVGGLLAGPAGAVVGAAYAADRANHPKPQWAADALEYDIDVHDRFNEVVLNCMHWFGPKQHKLIIQRSGDPDTDWVWFSDLMCGQKQHHGIDHFLELLEKRIPAARAVRAAQLEWLDVHESLDDFTLDDELVQEVIGRFGTDVVAQVARDSEERAQIVAYHQAYTRRLRESKQAWLDSLSLVATHDNGAPITFDSARGWFYSGEVPLEAGQVAQYARTGQLSFASEAVEGWLYSWVPNARPPMSAEARKARARKAGKVILAGLVVVAVGVAAWPITTEVKYRAGIAALDEGDFEAAVSEFDGLGSYRDSEMLRAYSLGMKAYEEGHYRGARVHLAGVAGLEGYDVESMLRQADEATLREDYTAAVERGNLNEAYRVAQILSVSDPVVAKTIESVNLYRGYCGRWDAVGIVDNSGRDVSTPRSGVYVDVRVPIVNGMPGIAVSAWQGDSAELASFYDLTFPTDGQVILREGGILEVAPELLGNDLGPLLCDIKFVF